MSLKPAVLSLYCGREQREKACKQKDLFVNKELVITQYHQQY